MSARARASRSTDGGRLAPGVLSDPDMVGRGYGGSHLDAPAVATPSMTTVLIFLVVAFLAVPIVEIYLIVEVVIARARSSALFGSPSATAARAASTSSG